MKLKSIGILLIITIMVMYFIVPIASFFGEAREFVTKNSEISEYSDISLYKFYNLYSDYKTTGITNNLKTAKIYQAVFILPIFISFLVMLFIIFGLYRLSAFFSIINFGLFILICWDFVYRGVIWGKYSNLNFTPYAYILSIIMFIEIILSILLRIEKRKLKKIKKTETVEQ